MVKLGLERTPGMGTKILAISLGGTAFALALAGPVLIFGPQSAHHAQRNEVYPIRIALPPPEGVGGLTPVAALAPAEGEIVTEANGPANAAASALFADWPSIPQGERNVGTQRLLEDVKFDLAQVSRRGEHNGSSASLEVRKPVNLDGDYQGEARIYVLSDSLLAINRDELNQLLVTAGKPNLDRGTQGSEATGEIITFDDLRELGIGIRYDPNGDRIIVST